MRTYADAQGKAGSTELVSYAGGRSRYVHWEARDDGSVAARLFGTDVVTFRPDRVEIRTGGFVTPSTFDAISHALGGRGFRGGRSCGTDARIAYTLGIVMSEGMRFDYRERFIGHGQNEAGETDWTPAAPRRRSRQGNAATGRRSGPLAYRPPHDSVAISVQQARTNWHGGA